MVNGLRINTAKEEKSLMPQPISQLLHPTPRVVFMSSFVPRECGLATFTEDVLNAVSAHGVSCKVIAMNRPRQRFNYDRRVIASRA